jgi:cytochrome c biogenesis protein CcdA
VSSARRVAAFVAFATVALGGVVAFGVVHPRLARPDLQQYLPSITPATIVGAGLLDGINPCAFTVLLLLIAALLATTQVGGHGTVTGIRSRVMLLGSIYVGAVFLTYLALGVGVLSVGRFFTGSHVPSRLAAFAAVLLGLWMVKDVFLPDAGPRLEAPHALAGRAQAIARRSTIPALVGGGILIGLCTVPCSGAVYLAVLSLLAVDEQPVRAYSYLVLYNVLFIAPLLAILAVASSRRTLARLARWQQRHREGVRLAIGTTVIALGLGLLAVI